VCGAFGRERGGVEAERVELQIAEVFGHRAPPFIANLRAAVAPA
jgi:hypothetical protein